MLKIYIPKILKIIKSEFSLTKKMSENIKRNRRVKIVGLFFLIKYKNLMFNDELKIEFFIASLYQKARFFRNKKHPKIRNPVKKINDIKEPK